MELDIFKFKYTLLTLLIFFLSNLTFAECSDFDAKIEADKSAQKYLSGTTFKTALILKKHLPSKRKEIASYVYVKESNLYYTVYSLVNSECEPRIVKRTKGKH
jgi:hypothetical protein